MSQNRQPEQKSESLPSSAPAGAEEREHAPPTCAGVFVTHPPCSSWRCTAARPSKPQALTPTPRAKRTLGDPSRPNAYAEYYAGCARDLAARIATQQAGQGAKMIRYAIERGITFEVVETWTCDSIALRAGDGRWGLGLGGPGRCVSLRAMAEAVSVRVPYGAVRLGEVLRGAYVRGMCPPFRAGRRAQWRCGG